MTDPDYERRMERLILFGVEPEKPKRRFDWQGWLWDAALVVMLALVLAGIAGWWK